MALATHLINVYGRIIVIELKLKRKGWLCERIVKYGIDAVIYNTGYAWHWLVVFTIEYIQIFLLMRVAPLAIDLVILDDRLCGYPNFKMICYVVCAAGTVYEIDRESVNEKKKRNPQKSIFS